MIFKIKINHTTRPPTSSDAPIEYISISAFQKVDESDRYIRWIYSTIENKWRGPWIITENQYFRAKQVLQQNLNSNYVKSIS